MRFVLVLHPFVVDLRWYCFISINVESLKYLHMQLNTNCNKIETLTDQTSDITENTLSVFSHIINYNFLLIITSALKNPDALIVSTLSNECRVAYMCSSVIAASTLGSCHFFSLFSDGPAALGNLR